MIFSWSFKGRHSAPLENDAMHVDLHTLLFQSFRTRVISSSGRNPDELFWEGSLQRPSVCLSVRHFVCCKHFLVIAFPPKPLGECFETLSECSPQCLVVQVPKKIPDRRQTLPPSAILDFSCYRSCSKTTEGIWMKLGWYKGLYMFTDRWTKGRLRDPPSEKLLWTTSREELMIREQYAKIYTPSTYMPRELYANGSDMWTCRVHIQLPVVALCTGAWSWAPKLSKIDKSSVLPAITKWLLDILDF